MFLYSVQHVHNLPCSLYSSSCSLLGKPCTYSLTLDFYELLKHTVVYQARNVYKSELGASNASSQSISFIHPTLVLEWVLDQGDSGCSEVAMVI
jgi:hypothetical protein